MATNTKEEGVARERGVRTSRGREHVVGTRSADRTEWHKSHRERFSEPGIDHEG